MKRTQSDPRDGTWITDFGVLSIVADRDRASGWTVTLDGTPQSYVDLKNPSHLEFEYVRRLASVIDSAAPRGVPLRILYLGAGGLTLPRYVAHARPGSVQRVVERDAALTSVVRRHLPLPKGADIRVRTADAREAIEASAPDRFDLVIVDVYSGARVPGRFTSVEFAEQAARVLRQGGRYAVNLADGPPLSFTRTQVATLCSVFEDVCLMAEPGVVRGRRYGNLVAVAGTRLPVARLAAAATRDVFPSRLLHGDDLRRFAAGARPVRDAVAKDSPPPPPNLFA